MTNADQNQKSNRGFASMDENRQREIASQGGRAAHEKGTAHEWSSEEARAAGQKGGTSSHSGPNNNRTPQNREQLAATGSRGG